MRSSDPTFPLYPIMASLGFVVSLVPLPLHLQVWNSGTCAFMFWTSLSCLAKAINSIVWAGNINDSSPIWCDISSRLFIGSAVAIPASTLCISRRLYIIASVQVSSMSYSDKRRIIIVDLCIAFGLPILIMIISYIVQIDRCVIFEDIGCTLVLYNTLAAFFLVYAWPLVIGCVSFIYSASALRIFWKRRSQITQILGSNPSLSARRYIRLMVVCLADMSFNVPFAIVRVYATAIPTLKYIHSNSSEGLGLPAALWRSSKWDVVNVELARWFNVVSAFIFFALFGFGSDVRKLYKDSFQKCLQSLNRISIFEGIWRKQARESVLPSSSNDASLILTTLQQNESMLVGDIDLVEKQYSVDQDTTLQCQAVPDHS